MSCPDKATVDGSRVPQDEISSGRKQQPFLPLIAIVWPQLAEVACERPTHSRMVFFEQIPGLINMRLMHDCQTASGLGNVI